jgi:hypothetical protein
MQGLGFSEFLCGNEAYTDSLFKKIFLKVFPDKYLKLYKQKLSHKVEKSRLVNKNTSSICLDFQRIEPSSGSINFLVYWDLGIFGLGQKKDTFGDSLGLLSKEAKLFVGWVSALRNPCRRWVSCFNPTYVHLIFNSTHLLNSIIVFNYR